MARHVLPLLIAATVLGVLSAHAGGPQHADAECATSSTDEAPAACLAGRGPRARPSVTDTGGRRGSFTAVRSIEGLPGKPGSPAWAAWWASWPWPLPVAGPGDDGPALEEAPAPSPAAVDTPAPSVFARSQVVSLYGHPGVPLMGALGEYSPEGAADAALRLAEQHAAVRGAPVLAALHLIVAVAQPHPGPDGAYLERMAPALLDAYVAATEERGMLLFIDVQIGWSEPLREVRSFEEALLRPHVHVALDPEFATRRKGQAPGRAIGSVTGAEVNAVQDYLAALVHRRHLPPKVLVVHQFRDDMVLRPDEIAPAPGVDLVIDMDGWGPPEAKLEGYRKYGLSPYATYAGFKLFYKWDVPLLTIEQIQALEHPPHYVIYQ